MKTLRPNELSKLPTEVLGLVQRGVYSLYAIRAAGAAYLLKTNRGERYFLSNAGEISGAPPRQFTDADIIDVVLVAPTAAPTREVSFG